MPWLAALVCASAFDIALHDAYGVANDRPVYDTYTKEFLDRDLSAFLEPQENLLISRQHPADYLEDERRITSCLASGRGWIYWTSSSDRENRMMATPCFWKTGSSATASTA